MNSNLVDSLKKESLDLAIVYSGNPCLNALTHLVAVPTIYFDTEGNNKFWKKNKVPQITFQGLTDETLIAAGAPIDLLTPPSHCFIAESKGYPILNLYKNSVCYFQEMIAQLGLPAVSSLVSSRHRLLDEPITNIFRTDYTIKKRWNFFDLVCSGKVNPILIQLGMVCKNFLKKICRYIKLETLFINYLVPGSKTSRMSIPWNNKVPLILWTPIHSSSRHVLFH